MNYEIFSEKFPPEADPPLAEKVIRKIYTYLE